MAELADALDLGSSVYDVQVQVLSSALSQICGIEFIRMMRIGIKMLISGCGSAWLERLVWDQEVAGSNPVTPTLRV